MGDAGVVAVTLLCPQMAALGLHCCRRLTDAAMHAAAARLTSLTSLNVSGCVPLSAQAVQARRARRMRPHCVLHALMKSRACCSLAGVRDLPSALQA